MSKIKETVIEDEEKITIIREGKQANPWGDLQILVADKKSLKKLMEAGGVKILDEVTNAE